jgi:hypothetical protein
MIQKELSQKRLPRLLLVQEKQKNTEPLRGLALIWPDRSESMIFDISFAGLSVSSANLMGKLKLGEFIEPRIRISGMPETLKLKLKVVSQSAQNLGLAFDATTVEGKLTLEQGLKDLIILEHFRKMNFEPHPFAQGLRTWFHGPFDTNIFIYEESSPYNMAVECDHVIALYGANEWIYRKSIAAIEESKSYFGPLFQAIPGNVSPGASWLSRLVRWLEQHPAAATELSLVIERLRKQRAQ